MQKKQSSIVKNSHLFKLIRKYYKSAVFSWSILETQGQGQFQMLKVDIFPSFRWEDKQNKQTNAQIRYMTWFYDIKLAGIV